MVVSVSIDQGLPASMQIVDTAQGVVLKGRGSTRNLVNDTMHHILTGCSVQHGALGTAVHIPCLPVAVHALSLYTHRRNHVFQHVLDKPPFTEQAFGHSGMDGVREEVIGDDARNRCPYIGFLAATEQSHWLPLIKKEGARGSPFGLATSVTYAPTPSSSLPTALPTKLSASLLSMLACTPSSVMRRALQVSAMSLATFCSASRL